MKEEFAGREVWLDWMRVAACFMVMVVHCTEPFYLGGDGALILSHTDLFWTDFFDSLVRACVPLFVVASSYLLFPLKCPTGDFFRRRAVRILVPFVIWSLVYAFVNGPAPANLRDLAFNFNYSAGHLWFVYMLVGLYILMPLLSPWAEKVGRRELQIYIGIWFLSTIVPLVRDWLCGAPSVVTYGPTGIPRQALYPLWGEASWNAYGVFYYFSGFIGYMFIGLYLKKFVGELSWGRTLAVAVPSFLAGVAVVSGGFYRRVMETSGGVFPTGGLVDTAVWWETTWCNDTVGVALMTVAWILLFRKIKSSGIFYRNVLLPVSKAGYGMYLCHMLVLAPLSGFFRDLFGTGAESSLGFWTAPVEILLASVSTFVLVAFVSVIVRRIPKIGSFIIG